MEAWPEPVERVAAFLRAAGAEARLEELEEETGTAADAARAVGCDAAMIVKSLVFVCDERPVLVLVPGDRRADAEKIAAAAGASKARVAAADQVEVLTGFRPGAVAPFPVPRVSSVLVERTLLQHHHVWVGAGSPRHLAELTPTELVRLAQARALDAVVAPRET